MKRIRWTQVLYWLGLALLLLAAGLLLFSRLGDHVISEWDEARHGVNAYEMLQSGDYVVSTYGGETDYFNLKPPLSFYGILLGYQLFGFNAFAMRFYSALSMLICITIVALWTKRRCGPIASLGSALFFVGCATIYGPHFARFGDADALMALFYTIGILCMLDTPRSPRYLYGSALCFGLAFLAKSWHAALIPLTCLVYLCVTGQIRKLRPRHYLMLLFCGLLPILPWAIARYQRDGWVFFQKMLSRDVLDRASTVIENHNGGWDFYLKVLAQMPAVVLSCAVCLLALVGKRVAKTRLNQSSLYWGLALWIAVPLLLFSLCASKLEWYIYVCLPAFAILLGVGLQSLLRQREWIRWPALGCAAAACALLVVWGFGNWDQIQNHLKDTDHYQSLINDYFDRDSNSGDHIYIEYEKEEGAPEYVGFSTRSWIQDDQLTAMLAGDLICLPGGSEAFQQDEEHAYLICHKVGMDWDLLEEYPIVSEEHPLMLLENLN